MGRLSGKLAVVTGAARGIGRAIAAGFAAEGAAVALFDRNGEQLDEAVGEIGQRAYAVRVDVTEEASVEAAFAAVRSRSGRIDVLLNSAGVQLIGRDGPAHELPLEVWQQTMAVNLTGMFLTCKHGIRLMLEGQGGSIINVGSPTGLEGSALGFDAYSTSKGGVFALTRILATEYAGRGIRVNTLVPGCTETPLITDLLSDPAARERLVSAVPLGRLAKPEDYVGIATYLAGDESSFATGASFVIDGGQTIA
ncbi:MAG TPA: glucose 1-dehydrogenase [Candidatus Dormibacteraeota bacterium]|nr:glucose 1-dehydrogenase [Candidatus Dormibacteraeota bacterium]